MRGRLRRLANGRRRPSVCHLGRLAERIRPRICGESRCSRRGLQRAGGKDVPEHDPPLEQQTLRCIDGYGAVRVEACFQPQRQRGLREATLAQIVAQVDVQHLVAFPRH